MKKTIRKVIKVARHMLSDKMGQTEAADEADIESLCVIYWILLSLCKLLSICKFLVIFLTLNKNGDHHQNTK